jgi:HTH-type transcriptional regulator/antitoxin MqsA
MIETPITRTPRYCLQCDDGTVLEFGTRDVAGEIRGAPYLARRIRGWHCPVCGDVEFAQDDDGALRVGAAIRAAGGKTHPQTRELTKA